MPSAHDLADGRDIGPQMPVEGSHTPISHATSNAEQSLGSAAHTLPGLAGLVDLQRSPVSTQGSCS
jgi:hypothetical protein